MDSSANLRMLSRKSCSSSDKTSKGCGTDSRPVAVVILNRGLAFEGNNRPAIVSVSGKCAMVMGEEMEEVEGLGRFQGRYIPRERGQRGTDGGLKSLRPHGRLRHCWGPSLALRMTLSAKGRHIYLGTALVQAIAQIPSDAGKLIACS